MDYIFIAIVLLFVGINHYMSWKKIKVLKNNTKILEDYKTDFENSQDELATVKAQRGELSERINIFSIRLSKADETIKSLIEERDKDFQTLTQVTDDYIEAKKYLDFYKQLKEYRVCKDEKCYNIKHAQTAYCIDHLGDHIGEDNVIGGIDVDDKRT